MFGLHCAVKDYSSKSEFEIKVIGLGNKGMDYGIELSGVVLIKEY